MDKTFIFDLDGTLITLPIDYDELREEMKKFFNVDYDFFRIIQTAVSLSKDNKNTLEEAFGIICEKENDAIKSTRREFNHFFKAKVSTCFNTTCSRFLRDLNFQ